MTADDNSAFAMKSQRVEAEPSGHPGNYTARHLSARCIENDGHCCPGGIDHRHGGNDSRRCSVDRFAYTHFPTRL